MDGSSGTRSGAGGDTSWVSGGLPTPCPVGICAARDAQLTETTSHRKTTNQRGVKIFDTTFSKSHGMFVYGFENATASCQVSYRSTSPQRATENMRHHAPCYWDTPTSFIDSSLARSTVDNALLSPLTSTPSPLAVTKKRLPTSIATSFVPPACFEA